MTLEVYRNVPVAVFGASGFIGRWVAKRLGDLGGDVTCFTRTPDRTERLLARYGVVADVAEGSTDDLDWIVGQLEAIRPAVTFNLTAYGVNPADRDPDTARFVNRDFAEWLARALSNSNTQSGRWIGNRLVHAGTQYEYGAVERFHEETEPVPTTVYGETKLEGAEAVMDTCAATGLTAVNARIFNVFGPGEAAHRLLPSLARVAETGEPIDLTSGEQQRDFCVVHDVAEGLLRLGAAEPLAGDPVNLASGRLVQVRQVILEAAHQLHIDTRLLRFGARPDRPAEILKPLVFVDRLRHLTGWLPETSLAEGIRRTVAFMRQAT